MKRFLILLLTVCMLSSMTVFASAEDSSAAAEVDKSDWVKLDLTYSTHLTETNATNSLFLVYFVGRLQDKMGEEYINVTPYFNGTLVGQTEALDGIIDGISDVTIFEPATFAARLPVTCMFGYPGVICGSGTAGTAAFYEFLMTEDLAELDNIHVLWCDRSGPANLNTSKPVEDASDLSGLQIRGTALFGETITALGGTPVSVPINDVYEGIRNGLIDGIYQSSAVMALLKTHEVAGYSVILPLVASPTIFAMNKDVYESMPESQREVFDACAEDTFYNMVLTFQDDVYKSVSIKDFLAGTEIRFVDDEELERAAEKCSTILTDYVENTINAAGLDGDKYYADFMALMEKYGEQYPYEEFKAMVEGVLDGSIPVVETMDLPGIRLEETRAKD